jgi:hypothetical protein
MPNKAELLRVTGAPADVAAVRRELRATRRLVMSELQTRRADGDCEFSALVRSEEGAALAEAAARRAAPRARVERLPVSETRLRAARTPLAVHGWAWSA